MGWLSKVFGIKKEADTEASPADLEELQAVAACRELAFEICVQRIAAAISKCEFRTFEKGKEVKGELYYRLNIRPNANQSGAEFWQKVIRKLYYQQEALIVQPKPGSFFVADSFDHDNEVLKEKTYSAVAIGDLTLKKKFKASEVFHFKLHNQRLKSLLAGTLELQEGLMEAAAKNFRRGQAAKMIVHLDRSRTNQPGFEDKFNKIVNHDIKLFMGEDSTMLPEHDGMKYSPIDLGNGKSSDTRDIKALLDDILEVTSKAFLMPVNIAAGEVTDTSKAVDDFLTFCLDRVVEVLEDGLNATGYSMEDYLKGSRIKIDTRCIKHVDILDAAGSIDKLISSGAFNFNEVRRMMSAEDIKEDWANEHVLTKNYSSIEDALNPLEGGEVSEAKENDVPDVDSEGGA